MMSLCVCRIYNSATSGVDRKEKTTVPQFSRRFKASPI